MRSFSFLIACGAVACVNDAVPIPMPDASDSGDKIDTGSQDASQDAPTMDADAGPMNAYLDPTSASNWEEVLLAAANGFSGGGYLNGYVYFAPNVSTVYRYDVQKPFTSVGSFDPVDISKFDPSVAVKAGYHGVVPDTNGRIWFINTVIPANMGGVTGVYVNAIDGKDITMSAAWKISPFLGDSRMYGYFGGATDGMSMFWFPNIKNNCNGCAPYALFLLRHPIGMMGYENTDLLATSMALTGIFGGTVVNGFVYTSPSGGVALRHATGNLLNALDMFTTSTLSPSVTITKGAVYDGQYIYFPGVNVVARYDTFGDFTKAAAWSSTNVSSAIAGGQFDGQRVIFAPDGQGPALIYDTKKPFSQPTSWQTHALKGTISGTAFDGQYVYFAPADVTTPLQRFHARTVAMSPVSGGSSF